MRKKYPLYHMAGMDDVFLAKDDYSWLKGEGNVCRNYSVPSKHALAKQIFHCFMKKAMEDIVEENHVLAFPLYEAAMLIEEIPPQVMEKRKAEGKMLHFSDIFAYGKGYDMIYRHKKNGKYLKCRVIMGSALFTRFLEKVNNGFRYFGIAKIW